MQEEIESIQSDDEISFEELAPSVGPDLREDTEPSAIYYKLRDARGSARAVERGNTGKKPEDWDPNPHWRTILELAPQALEQSKDLEIAAWYTEALLREQGFGGLAEGFQLIQTLVEEFGSALYPQDEEEGIEATLAPLAGLNGIGSSTGTLISPINCILITNCSGQNYATWQYTQSVNLARAPNEEVRRDRIKNGVPVLDQLVAAAKNTGASFYQQLLADLNASVEAYRSLIRLLEEKFEEDAPPSNQIRQALEGCRQAIQTIAKDLLENKKSALDIPLASHSDAAEEEFSSETAQSSQENLSNSFSGFSLQGQFSTRQEALNLLKQLADFFKQTEPHSPIGYTLERALRWSQMGLPDLFAELVEDEQVQRAFSKITGSPFKEPVIEAPAMHEPDYSNSRSSNFEDYSSPPQYVRNNDSFNEDFSSRNQYDSFNPDADRNQSMFNDFSSDDDRRNHF